MGNLHVLGDVGEESRLEAESLSPFSSQKPLGSLVYGVLQEGLNLKKGR